MVEKVRVQHGCGCLSGAGTLLFLGFIVFALPKGWTIDHVAWSILGILALGGVAWVAYVWFAPAKATAPAPLAPPTPQAELHPAPTTKRCPDCAETVQKEARICRFCRYQFQDSG